MFGSIEGTGCDCNYDFFTVLLLKEDGATGYFTGVCDEYKWCSEIGELNDGRRAETLFDVLE